MTKRLYVIASTFLAASLVLFLAKSVSASEGIFKMGSTTGENYRCYATSVLLENRSYRILLSCRNLLYPAGTDIFFYVLWANPIEGNKQIKLGSVDFGKGLFNTKTPFNRLYVTIEKNKSVREPAGITVMSGNFEPIEFLRSSPTPTPTPQEGEEGEVTGTTTPQQELSTRDKLLIGLRRAGLVALFALIALIGLIFVVTRSRG
jgi:hypothetical protein